MNKGPFRLQFENHEWQYRSIFDSAIDGLIIIDLETGCVVEANPAACMMYGFSRPEFIGLPLTAFIDPDSQKVFDKYFRAYQAIGIFEATMENLRQDGTSFFASWRGSPFTYRDRTCLLSVVRDISRRIQAQVSLQKKVEIHTHEQNKILEISQALASMLEFQPGLILNQLHEIVEYTQGGIFALMDSSLVVMAMHGTPQLEQTKSVRVHLEGPESLVALFNGHHPVIIHDIWSDDPQAMNLRSILENGAAVLLEGMQSWMWVPLSVKGKLIGCLGMAHEEGNFFTRHQADLALGIANQVAITMVNAQLYEHAQELAIQEERQRLARNLHDAINQSLFSAGLIAEVLPRLWDRDQAEARRSIDDLLRLTRGAQAEMRSLLAELRPATLIESNLNDLLILLGNALTGRANIPVIINIKDEITLPADVQVGFYRVCQEALFNIAKHSKASHVMIDVISLDGNIEMNIRDDGIGFDLKYKTFGHYGLGMMQEHAESVGAQFSVTSQPGQGTIVTLRWKARASEEAL